MHPVPHANLRSERSLRVRVRARSSREPSVFEAVAESPRSANRPQREERPEPRGCWEKFVTWLIIAGPGLVVMLADTEVRALCWRGRPRLLWGSLTGCDRHTR
jgi:hypothetical protein